MEKIISKQQTCFITCNEKGDQKRRVVLGIRRALKGKAKQEGSMREQSCVRKKNSCTKNQPKNTKRVTQGGKNWAKGSGGGSKNVQQTSSWGFESRKKAKKKKQTGTRKTTYREITMELSKKNLAGKREEADKTGGGVVWVSRSGGFRKLEKTYSSPRRRQKRRRGKKPSHEVKTKAG